LFLVPVPLRLFRDRDMGARLYNTREKLRGSTKKENKLEGEAQVGYRVFGVHCSASFVAIDFNLFGGIRLVVGAMLPFLYSLPTFSKVLKCQIIINEQGRWSKYKNNLLTGYSQMPF